MFCVNNYVNVCICCKFVRLERCVLKIQLKVCFVTHLKCDKTGQYLRRGERMGVGGV